MRKAKLEDRKEFVRNYVNNSSNVTEAVKELSEKLYLSEQTIWKDLS